METQIGTIIAKTIGVILLLVSLIFLPAIRICFRLMIDLVLYEPNNNLNEKSELWLEKAGNFQKITVPTILKAIFTTLASLSVGRDYILDQTRMARCKADNFRNRTIYAITIIEFRWCILPFVVGVGLILTGNLWLILVLPIALILSKWPFFPFSIVMGVYCLVSGWIYGGLVYSYLFSGSGEWFYVASGVGVLCMCLVYCVIEAIITPSYLIKKMIIEDKLRKIRESGQYQQL